MEPQGQEVLGLEVLERLAQEVQPEVMGLQTLVAAVVAVVLEPDREDLEVQGL
jgi:hypothetical protein